METICCSSDEKVTPIQPTCGYNSCEGCSFRAIDVYRLLKDEKEMLKFFFLHGVISCHIVCPKCRAGLQYRGNSRFLICRRITQKGGLQCKMKISLYRDTFFFRSHLSLSQVVQVVYNYITRPPPRVRFIEEETGISGSTLACWFNIIREVFIFWAVCNSEKLGGEGVVVEIDEAKLEKRKESRGRSLKGEWIVGGIEKNTKRFFLVAVEDNSADTLTTIIKERIRPGTTIYSSSWNGYDRFGNQYYEHLTQNHLIKLVDPAMKTNHPGLQGMWAKIKNKVRGPGLKTERFLGYLSERLFMIKYPSFKERFHAFWKTVGAFYPGIPHA